VQESTAGSRRRGPAPARTPEQVVEAAVALADREGLERTTLRALAASLGVAAAGLYRYVPSRAVLVERMVDAVLAELDATAITGDAVTDVTAWTAAQVRLLRRHPWLVDTLRTVPPGAHAVDALDRGLAALAPLAADGAAKLETLALLTGVATLFARTDARPGPGAVEALTVAAATHPHLAAAVADPGAASAPEELLSRAVRALTVGLLPPGP
jgi:AcrR family transcriptional regulator